MHEGGDGGVRKPYLFKAKGFSRFGPRRFSGKQNQAVVRFDSRKMVNFRRRKEQSPFSIGHSFMIGFVLTHL